MSKYLFCDGFVTAEYSIVLCYWTHLEVDQEELMNLLSCPMFPHFMSHISAS